MTIMKKLLQLLLWLAILALLIVPLVLIYRISVEERKAYAAPEPPILKQTAYGEPRQAHRQDAAEQLTVSGVWVSGEVKDQELAVHKPWLIRWQAEPGDELREGQLLGTLNGKQIVAEHEGVLLEINASSAENAYLRIRPFEATALECRLDAETLGRLKNAADLQTERGNAASVEFAARVPDAEGNYTVRLRVEGAAHTVGETERALVLLTGQIYRNALVLDSRCVYQKQPGEGESMYARRVTPDGTLLGEVEVAAGARIGDLVCISGVSEGEWFDSGYKAVVESAWGAAP